MRGIKIPQENFALKRQGGLMCEGGHICGTLWYYSVFHSKVRSATTSTCCKRYWFPDRYMYYM